MLCLYDLIDDGYGTAEQYNCSEKIISGANIAYEMNLSDEARKLMAGFGSGMEIGDACGAATACVAVISFLFINDVAKTSAQMKFLVGEFLTRFRDKLGTLNCMTLLKEISYQEGSCNSIVLAAAEILDDIVLRELNK